MDFDSGNPVPLYDEQDFKNYLKLETLLMAAPGYAESKGNVKTFRARAVKTVISEKCDVLVPCIAMQYFDHFCSRNQLQILLGDELHDAVLIAYTCLMIAHKIKDDNFILSEFLEKNKIEELKMNILEMKRRILKGLECQMLAITPVCCFRFFVRVIPPARHVNKDIIIKDIIIPTQEDISFTKFRPSVIGASAILAAFRFLYPDNYTGCKNILLANIGEGVVEEDLQKCFMKTFEMCVKKKFFLERSPPPVEDGGDDPKKLVFNPTCGNDLPPELMEKIIQLLPTKYAVGTTLISREWNNVWMRTRLSHLELDDTLLPHPGRLPSRHRSSLFVDFVDRVLHCANLDVVKRVHIRCLGVYPSSLVSSWIEKLTSVDELDIEIAQGVIVLPSAIYSSLSLRVLRINSDISICNLGTSNCFLVLKQLSITVSNYRQMKYLMLICKSAPCLEELLVEMQLRAIDRYSQSMTISSRSIRKLKLNLTVVNRKIHHKFIIEGERLQVLEVSDDWHAEYVVANAPSLQTVFLSLGYCLGEHILAEQQRCIFQRLEIFKSISHLQHLRLSESTILELEFITKTTNMEDMPVFSKLTKLEVGNARFLGKLLERMPLLKQQMAGVNMEDDDFLLTSSLNLNNLEKIELYKFFLS